MADASEARTEISFRRNFFLTRGALKRRSDVMGRASISTIALGYCGWVALKPKAVVLATFKHSRAWVYPRVNILFSRVQAQCCRKIP